MGKAETENTGETEESSMEEKVAWRRWGKADEWWQEKVTQREEVKNDGGIRKQSQRVSQSEESVITWKGAVFRNHWEKEQITDNLLVQMTSGLHQ